MTDWTERAVALLLEWNLYKDILYRSDFRGAIAQEEQKLHINALARLLQSSLLDDPDTLESRVQQFDEASQRYQRQLTEDILKNGVI